MPRMKLVMRSHEDEEERLVTRDVEQFGGQHPGQAGQRKCPDQQADAGRRMATSSTKIRPLHPRWKASSSFQPQRLCGKESG